MGYEINVSLNGKHFFATHERSIRNTWELKKVLSAFKEKFPPEEGYKITVYEKEAWSKEVSMDSVLTEE